MTRINLAAERARSAQRREREHLRARARQILGGRWNMTALEIGAAIEEAYPDLPDEQARLLAAVTRQVQRDEAPKRIPVGSVEVQPWEPDDPRMEISRSDAKAWTEILASGLKSRAASNPKPKKRKAAI